LEPADGAVVEANTITIRGRTSADAVVTINGDVAEVDSNGNFSLRVVLEEGGNVFDIIATDEQENQATEELVLFFLPRR